jgi:hypothetical protein
VGPIETGVTADLEHLTEPGTAALKATAIRLARTLDEGAGLATAAVARELRATLASLTREEPTDDADGFAALVAALSSPVQHTSES